MTDVQDVLKAIREPGAFGGNPPLWSEAMAARSAAIAVHGNRICEKGTMSWICTSRLAGGMNWKSVSDSFRQALDFFPRHHPARHLPATGPR
ncbi:MAG: hypothetical protein WCL16_11770 [bacterium]